LPETLDSEISELGRITKPIAMAFKAKALVHAASPFFNGNALYAEFKDKRGVQLFSETADPQKWVKAAAACKEAIEMCEKVGHSLFRFPGFAGITLSDDTKLTLTPSQIITTAGVDNTNTEAIWMMHFNADALQQSHMPFTSVKGGSTRRVREGATMATAERFYSSNGIPIEEDKEWDENGWYLNRYEIAERPDGHEAFVTSAFPTANLNFRREYRYYGSIAFDGSLWYGGISGTVNESTMSTIRTKAGAGTGMQGDQSFSPTGMYVRKTVSWETNDGPNITTTPAWRSKPYMCTVMRLADLYLLCAEALNEASSSPTGDPNGITDSNSPYTWLNRIRERAGLEPVGDSWDNWSKNDKKYTTKAGLRDIIHQERMNELAFEGHYWFDIRRWSGADPARYDIMQIMNRPLYGWNVAGAGDDFYNPSIVLFPTFTLRDYLWPIRESNIVERNPNLIQNPGW